MYHVYYIMYRIYHMYYVSHIMDDTLFSPDICLPFVSCVGFKDLKGCRHISFSAMATEEKRPQYRMDSILSKCAGGGLSPRNRGMVATNLLGGDVRSGEFWVKCI